MCTYPILNLVTYFKLLSSPFAAKSFACLFAYLAIFRQFIIMLEFKHSLFSVFPISAVYAIFTKIVPEIAQCFLYGTNFIAVFNNRILEVKYLCERKFIGRLLLRCPSTPKSFTSKLANFAIIIEAA